MINHVMSPSQYTNSPIWGYSYEAISHGHHYFSYGVEERVGLTKIFIICPSLFRYMAY